MDDGGVNQDVHPAAGRGNNGDDDDSSRSSAAIVRRVEKALLDLDATASTTTTQAACLPSAFRFRSRERQATSWELHGGQQQQGMKQVENSFS